MPTETLVGADGPKMPSERALVGLMLYRNGRSAQTHRKDTGAPGKNHCRDAPRRRDEALASSLLVVRGTTSPPAAHVLLMKSNRCHQARRNMAQEHRRDPVDAQSAVEFLVFKLLREARS